MNTTFEKTVKIIPGVDVLNALSVVNAFVRDYGETHTNGIRDCVIYGMDGQDLIVYQTKTMLIVDLGNRQVK